MGKNHSIYFDDETDSLVGSVEGKGTLINQLIKDYFSNDEEVLRRKLEKIDIERTAILKKLEAKQNERARKLLEGQKKQQLTKEQQYKEDIKSELLEIYKQDKLTDDQYSECFNKEGIIIDKAKELINATQT
jgi:hypothetical protein